MPQESHRAQRAVCVTLLATMALIATTMLPYSHTSASNLPGIVSRWSAEGNANDSVGSNNGTLLGGVTFAPGIVGQAYAFDGFSAHVEVPDSSAWSFGANPFTIELWAQFNNAWGGALLASSNGPGQQPKWIFGGGEYARGLSFHCSNLNGDVNFPYSFLPAQWYHLAITRNGSTFALYINGIEVTNSTDSAVLPDASAPLKIGEAEGESHTFFNGLLDEIGIYDRALAPGEIQSIFNAGAPASAPAIFGTAKDGSGPLTISLSGSQTATTTTDVNGFYRFDGLASSGTYTVTPSKTGYVFIPASQTFSNLTESKIAHFVGWLTTDLSISITSSGWAITGNTLLYRIRIINYGPPVDGVTLTSMVPGVLYPADDPIFFNTGDYWESSPAGDHFNFHFSIPVSGVYELNLAFTPTEVGTLTNTVSVTYAGDTNSTNNTDTATTTVVTLPVPTASSCAMPPQGGVVWWPGDGNANDITAGHDGTLQGGATFAPGISGQAFSLGTSTDSYVEVPDSSAWSFGANQFTLALWAKFNQTGNYQALIASNEWVFWYFFGSLGFHIDRPGGNPDQTLSYLWKPEADQWYHLAVTRDASSTYTLYINGIAVDRVTNSKVIPDASAPLTIGETEGSFFFNGLLDEIGIYNRALTAVEIQSIFNAGNYGQCKTASFTRTGSNVTVQTDAGTFTFDNVSTSGTTSISAIDPATVGQVPGGFAVSNSVAYEISSSAAFTGSVKLAFKVPGPISQADFNLLAILHNVNGTLVDVTATTPVRDYSTLTIYATTNSFSPFYLARRGPHINTLFDQTKAYKSGSTIPVKMQLLSASHSNLSSSGTTLIVRGLKLISGNSSAPVVDSGNANPDSTFRYDPMLGGTGGGYIFNLSTKGLVPGQYVLSFYVGSDRSFFYTVKFEVK